MTISLTKSELSVFALVAAGLLLFNVTPAIILLNIIIFISFYLKRKEIYFVWSLVSPRITGSAPMLVNLLALAREEGPGNKQLNDVFRLDIPFLKPIFCVFKPEYLNKILALETDNFLTSGYQGPLIKLAGDGNNVLLSDGSHSSNWARFREISSPINKDRFGETSLLGHMFEDTWKACQEIALRYNEKQNQSLDLYYELYHVVVHAHNRAFFGEEIAKKYSGDHLADDVYHVIIEAGKQLNFPLTSPSKERNLLAGCARVMESVMNMAKSSSSKFMQPFQEAMKKGNLTEEELRSNLMVFEYSLAPLHATFWVLYMLSLHPEVERNVVSEITQILSKRPMNYTTLSEFTYLAKVVSETLRLIPGVGVMQARFAQNNCMLGSNYIPAGSMVLTSPYLIHRNARFWANPDEFDPSREGLDTSNSGKSLTQLPFGYGPRQCQGQFFAQDLIKVAVISLLQHHKISLVGGQKEAVPSQFGFCRPESPIYVTFTQRHLNIELIPKDLPLPKVEKIEISEKKVIAQAEPKEIQAASEKFSVAPQTLSPLLKIRSLKKPVLTPPQCATPPLQDLSYAIMRSQSRSQAQIDAAEGADHLTVEKILNAKEMLVLYGSQTGNSRSLAFQLVHMGEEDHNISATCLSMAECPLSEISKYKMLVIVTSTFGDGGPPSNAEKMNAWLEEDHPAGLWSGLSFAVLSLGSSAYAQPFKFGSFVSQRVSELGGKRILPDRKIDEIKYNQQMEFTEWALQLFETINTNTQQQKKLECATSNMVLSPPSTPNISNRRSSVTTLGFSKSVSPLSISFCDHFIKMEPRQVFPRDSIMGSVVSNELLCGEPSNHVYSIQLSLGSRVIPFQPGDTVLMFPTNDISLVRKLVRRLGVDGERLFKVNESSGLSCSLGKGYCSLEIALSHFYNITSSPSSSLLRLFTQYCESTDEQNNIENYIASYTRFMELEYTPFDVLELFPSVKLSGYGDMKDSEILAEFLNLLGPMSTKYYSIANSSTVTPNAIQLIYKAVDYTSKTGKSKRGICSNWLKSKNAGDKVAFSLLKTKFKTPQNESPVVMVGAGVGIAPFFGILEERLYLKKLGVKLGKAVLIQGCRTEADFPLRHKVDLAVSEGVLSELWCAYSRNVGCRSVHVNHVMEEHGAELWELLNGAKATLLLCGEMKMRASVRESCLKIAQTHGNLDVTASEIWLQQLVASKRLRY